MDQTRLTALIERFMPEPIASDDKYSRGVLGVVAGSDQYPGAAALVVAAAQTCSVGMVRYFGPDRVANLLLQNHPEVVVAKSVTPDIRVDAWVLGSGVHPDASAQHQNIHAALSFGTPAVVDAGALDLLDYESLRASQLILTPHAGELARLVRRWLPGRSDLFATESDLVRAEAARELSARIGQTLLAKGSVTFIASPAGSFAPLGPNDPHLATAGSGDVLAGLLGGFAAHHFEGWFEPAQVAVLLHSAMATAASRVGPVTASELPRFLPDAREILEGN